MYPKGAFKGKCKAEDKHAGSWGLGQQHGFCDSGRIWPDIWLPSARRVIVGIPRHTTNLDDVKVMSTTKYTVELYARSMPLGLTVHVTVGGWRQVDMTPTTTFGMTTYHEFVGSAAFDPAPMILGSNWTHITLDVPATN